MASLNASPKPMDKSSPLPAEDHKRHDSRSSNRASVSRRSEAEAKESETTARKQPTHAAKDSHSDDHSESESVVSDDDEHGGMTPAKENPRPIARTSSAPATKPEKNVSPTANAQVLPRKLSVAALIRSFSPRSRKKAQAEDGEGVGAQAEAKEEEGSKPKKKSPVTFGKLKRSSLSFPASPPASSATTTTTEQPAPARARANTTVASPASVSKWKQAVQAVTRDADRLRIQIPPLPSSPASHEQPPLSKSPAATVVDAEFTSGPGSFVDDVRTTLTKLLTTLDAIDPRKLNAIRLGGELRGLLGKAQDEFAAYEDAFRDHAGKVGVSIALQNFAASLHQVFPIVERLQTAKFMLNRQFKRDVTFAFQEINSYYTSMFMELSMSVAQNAGLVLPMPSPLKQVVEPQKPEEEEEEAEEAEEPPKPREPTSDELCLTAHQHFFGHGCQVDLMRALDLYKQAAAKENGIAKRCIGHMHLLGKGVEKDLFVAEKWLKEAASAGDFEAMYLLGVLLCEKAPNQKTESLTREFFTQAHAQFKLAAEHGHVESQHRLAMLLESGDSSDGDRVDESDRIRRAMPWYRRAAEQKHTKSESALGRILLLRYEGQHGDATEETRNNATEAIHWLQRAAASGEDADALTRLGVIFSTGRWSTKRDVDRGVAFLRRAVAAGSYEAMLHLARLLLEPCGAPGLKAVGSGGLPLQDREENHDEALRLLLTAAQCGGIVDAYYEVGELLFNSAMLRDRAAALRFFVKAAQSRPPHAIAARKAATMLYSGVGCKSGDKTRAHRFYTIAAEADDSEALNALGLMYEEGEGCDLDFQKALSCYRRAVELGSAHAHFNLGCLLAHGKGVARNLDAAQAHFQKALALGYVLARDFLRPET